MRIDLVIFDCDGVLVDSETITSQTIADSLADEGLSWTLEDVVKGFRGGSLAGVMAAAERELGSRLPDDYVVRFRELLFERLARDVKAVPGIHEALDGIEAAGLPYCVASNGPRKKMETTLGTTKLLARFDGRIYSAYEVGLYKPDPGLFLHAAAAHGMQPEHCVVIEDSESGLAAAAAAGMRAVGYIGHGIPMTTGAAHPLTSMAALPALLTSMSQA
jgi:HAD superfamily hydrolase (TIGR01509 family)